MPDIKIYVVDHRDHDLQPPGDIIRPWVVGPEDVPGARYADFCALYGVWQAFQAGSPGIIGFFGYRKYLCPLNKELDVDWIKPAHAPDWYQCPKGDFDIYRDFMAEWDGADIKRLLAQYDILQAAPFPLDREIWADFEKSRSYHDALLCNHIVPSMGTTKIYPYLFITRWSVFDRMMRELEPLRLKLDPLITAEDSDNDEYKKRPMAYVMERVYSLWLENSGLDIGEMPLLHCWEMT